MKFETESARAAELKSCVIEDTVTVPTTCAMASREQESAANVSRRETPMA
jgi:hypothetical protein